MYRIFTAMNGETMFTSTVQRKTTLLPKPNTTIDRILAQR